MRQVIQWSICKLTHLRKRVACIIIYIAKLHQLTLRFLFWSFNKSLLHLFLVEKNDSRVRLMPWTERRRLCTCWQLSVRRHVKQQVCLRCSMQNITRVKAVVMNESNLQMIQHHPSRSQQSTYCTGLEAQKLVNGGANDPTICLSYRFGGIETRHGVK